MVSFLEFANLPAIKARESIAQTHGSCWPGSEASHACASSSDRACPWLHFLCTWPVTTLNLPLFLSSDRALLTRKNLVHLQKLTEFGVIQRSVLFP